MRIHKILGNNGAIVLTDEGRESVAVGKGLTFGLHAGDSVDEKLIDRMYIPQETGIAAKFAEFVETLSLEYLAVCDDIIQLIKRELTDSLAEKMILSLIDHISFAIERHKTGINLSTGLNSVMKQAYPKEYEVGRKALTIIDKKLNVTLPSEEAAFIAFHLVNAGSATTAQSEQARSRFISAVIILIEEKLAIHIDRSTKIYKNFVKHLQEFVIIIIENKTSHDTNTISADNLPRTSQENPDITICINQIAELARRTFNYSLDARDKYHLFRYIDEIHTNFYSTEARG